MCVQMRSDGLALAINETKRAREVTVLKVRNFFFLLPIWALVTEIFCSGKLRDVGWPRSSTGGWRAPRPGQRPRIHLLRPAAG